jgi:outer membrane protein OmpA-like peptidoglycan-associated protein
MLRTSIRATHFRSAFLTLLILFAPNAGCKTDTGSGALLGAGGGALIGALVDRGNPAAGALIGAAGGALAGGVAGHFMDERKQNLEKDLAAEINAGQITVQLLPGKALQVTMTPSTAFAPGSSVINPAFIPTLQKIANVVSHYGKMTITVIGYPDNPSGSIQQASLAYQRAEAVRVQFIGMGVKPILVTATDYPASAVNDGRVQLILTPVSSH